MNNIGTSLVLLHPDQRIGADINRWLESGGGKAIVQAAQDPAAARHEVRIADLRGMGGSGFPVWRKWEAAASEIPKPDKYLVVNGNEDEQGTFKDRLLLEETPHQVIEGAVVAALAVGANKIVFYINPGMKHSISIMKNALKQWHGSDLMAFASTALGKQLELDLCISSGQYIGGDETAAIEWIEGRFPFPHVKPPYPVQVGVNGNPTLINNVETLAHVPHVLMHGGAWFKSLGIGAGSGTKLYSLSGDVLHTGVFELPMGTSLRELIFIHGGGLQPGKTLKAVFSGGTSSSLLTSVDIDVAMDFDSMRARGSSLGTGAMIVISDCTSIVNRVTEYERFFANSSCGQCNSCKIGTANISYILNRIDAGQGTAIDIATLKNISKMLPGSGRCKLVDGAVQMLESALLHFIDEFQKKLI